MAITVNAVAQLDEQALATLAARIRNTIRAAVHAGIQDALADLAPDTTLTAEQVGQLAPDAINTLRNALPTHGEHIATVRPLRSHQCGYERNP